MENIQEDDSMEDMSDQEEDDGSEGTSDTVPAKADQSPAMPRACPLFTPRLSDLALAARYRVQPSDRPNCDVTFVRPNRRSQATAGKRVRRRPKSSARSTGLSTSSLGDLSESERADTAVSEQLSRKSRDSIMSDITCLDFRDTPSTVHEPDDEISYRHARLDEGLASQRAYMAACRRLGTPVIATVLQSLLAEELVLRYHGLDPKAARATATALVDNGSVEVLDLRGNDLGPDGTVYVCAMLKENIFITDLCLAENYLGSRGLSHIVNIMNVNESLRVLSLAGNGLGDSDSEMLSSMLHENVTLRELDLSYNDFRQKGGKLLADSLAANTSLEVLDLSWNQLRGVGAEAMGRMLEHNIGLKVLRLGWNGFHVAGCRALGKALAVNSSLEQLDLTCNRVNSEGLGHLLKGLRSNQCLTQLLLSRNTFKEEGMLTVLQHLETAPPSPLKNLDISGPDVSKLFLMRVQTVLRANPSLSLSYGATSEPDDMIHLQENTLLQTERPWLVLMEYLRIQGHSVQDLFVQTTDSVSWEEFYVILRACNVPLSRKMVTSILTQLDSSKTGRVCIRDMAEEQNKYLDFAAQTLAQSGDSSDTVQSFGDTEIGRVHNKLKCFMNIRQNFWAQDVGLRTVHMKPFAYPPPPPQRDEGLPSLSRTTTYSHTSSISHNITIPS